MGTPNPNKSGCAKKKTLNKLKEGDAQKPLTEGGCPQRTKGIGCTLKKKFIGWFSNDEKRIRFGNLQCGETKRTNNKHRTPSNCLEPKGTKNKPL